MSKKTDTLADVALSDGKETNSEKIEKILSAEELSKELLTCVPVRFSLSNRRKGFISCGFENETVLLPPLTCYPVSVTDQIHALSMAEQIRNGYGDSSDELDKDNFDFPNGVDDGSEAHGIFELSNRVDAWIAEQNLSDELKYSFRSQVLQKQADNAMKETLAKHQAQQAKQVQNETQVSDKQQNTQK